ncbi:MAG: nucleotidyltransferase domain-containing protein [Bacteroidetes bacterium]|nr:nucleotidyltransferase domain-containing protein [Bacteroidota bacterium]MBU1681108.1 nucleotidyltransferase domain-containing protein [Bacteroidota bacterium]
MNIDKIKIKEKISAFLLEKEEIKLAYIFGSFINKEKYNDIDVAVYLNHEFNRNDLIKYPYGYESNLNSEINLLVREKIDFIVMNNSEITLQHRIINKGILLFSRDKPKRISYENYIRKLYIDSANIRKIKRKYLSRKIANA